MELSYKELKKREVINLVEGKSLGYITDLTLSFPTGNLIGITVPGRNVNCFTKLFTKSQLYIPSSKIVRIGNDVILVDLKCGETCSASTTVKNPKPKQNACNSCRPPQGGQPNYMQGEIFGNISDDEEY